MQELRSQFGEKKSEKVSILLGKFRFHFFLREKISTLRQGGNAGVGKSSLIRAVFGIKIETGVGLPVTRSIQRYDHPDHQLIIYDVPG